ncbi:MAG: hypothetical protein AB8B72_08040 [Crocinitomicaceae bacterium]
MLKTIKIYLLSCFAFFAIINSHAQSDLFKVTLPLAKSDTITIDTVSILNYGFIAEINGKKLNITDFELNTIKSTLVLKSELIATSDSIVISYYRTPINLNVNYNHKDDSLIFRASDTLLPPSLFSVGSDIQEFDFFSDNQLSKQGSISRGVSAGNAQNLSFQSTLNLQLSGKIGPDLFIKGSISDDNIPFQPDGNTQKLQEFDQVFLQIYNDDVSVTGGDFWLRKPNGYFLNYQKRSQGLSVDYKHGLANAKSNPTITHKISGAFSRGKFARNIVQGIEGNQGPYRLFGAENEQNIIILAGTESVFIDGVLLKRGQAFDYIIDYNGAEITFTANQFITKDKRIIVEFQYSDLNYARSLVAYNATVKAEKYQLWGNIYNEQDAKNQPIQQSLNLNQKNSLSLAGDNVSDAFVSSIFPTEFTENTLHYYLTDSLGIDSILVFTANKDSAEYRANFALVGENKGNYIIDRYTANGKIYKWVSPINNIPQGNYEPIQLLVAPKRNQMMTVGGQYQFNESTYSKAEFAYSKNDRNTFSDLDSGDDNGYGLKWELANLKRFKNKKLELTNQLNFEFNDKNFSPIQWFRSAEFDRDWNVRQKNYTGNQFISSFNSAASIKNLGKISYTLNQLTWGTDYSGWKNDILMQISKKGFNVFFNGNYLLSNGQEETKYARHQGRLSKKFDRFEIGLTDIFERNKVFQNNTLAGNSFQFYDIKSYVAVGDSTKSYHQLYYQQRHDWFSDSTNLKHAARANNYGITSQYKKGRAYQLKLNVNYRQLDILESDLINQQPEESILGRLEQNLYLWKGLLSSRIFYELNSGLELKRDFVFIQVNNGQGVYTWIDYNGDNIKDIGEFEIAQFADQAEYIRINIATTEFVRTYGNQFSQALFIKPERLWSSKKGVKKVIALFSNQTNYSINRKTSYEKGISALNPFDNNIADTSLINSLSSIRNTLFFNRLNPVFGMEYLVRNNTSKSLLTSGFSANFRQSQILKLRWNISKVFNLKLEYENGNRRSESDFASNRNFDYKNQIADLVFTYQPNTAFRIGLNAQYGEKLNDSELEEKAELFKIGSELRINQAKKGSFSANLATNIIRYNAASNTPLAFELLEALKPGVNFIWGISYQRKVATNLQLNFNYNGRKSEELNAIHSGGMELRAFF